ncbi:hypothetical protein GALL_550460 [mine drainage metagenome]|uniref:Uncharacterized protein n=1 Tax=mine drainage metagenome TaxID=410659 RepID=A0A1J5P7H7_9ZZZZ
MGRGLYAATIHPDLAGPAHLFHRTLGNHGELALQPTVQALLAVLDTHSQDADAAHASTARIMCTPPTSAANETTTDNPT